MGICHDDTKQSILADLSVTTAYSITFRNETTTEICHRKIVNVNETLKAAANDRTIVTTSSPVVLLIQLARQSCCISCHGRHAGTANIAVLLAQSMDYDSPACTTATTVLLV